MASISQVIITCRAAVCWGSGEPLKVEEIQVDPPKATEVRVKMLCASVCHTDITMIQGFGQGRFPQVPGHEGVGVIESIGEKVRNLKEGDIVIPTYIGECQECENCLSSNTNFCSKYPIGASGLMAENNSRMSLKGQKLYSVFGYATWSEYTVVDENYVVKVDPTIDLAHASFISCGFSTGYGATWKQAKVTSGSTVAVFGLGAVGLGALCGARMMGATKIIGVDKNEMKRKKGEAFGMTDFINPSASDKTPSELIMKLTNGKGVDYSFECVGVGPVLNQALESTKEGTGKTIALGWGSETIPISQGALLNGRTMMGAIFGGLKPKSDLPIIAHKCLEKEMALEELITHEVPLIDINKAFEFFKQSDCVKVVIKI